MNQEVAICGAEIQPERQQTHNHPTPKPQISSSDCDTLSSDDSDANRSDHGDHHPENRSTARQQRVSSKKRQAAGGGGGAYPVDMKEGHSDADDDSPSGQTPGDGSQAATQKIKAMHFRTLDQATLETMEPRAVQTQSDKRKNKERRRAAKKKSETAHNKEQSQSPERSLTADELMELEQEIMLNEMAATARKEEEKRAIDSLIEEEMRLMEEDLNG